MSTGKHRDLLAGTALLAGTVVLLRWPQESISAVREGISVCGNILIPSLFPFLVLSNLIISLELSHYLGACLEPLMRPLFRIGGNCSCALVLGLIGGYPIGARTAVSLYQSGQCSKTECERLLSFCNNSGPAFIFGVVGAGIFRSGTISLLLYLIHITASLLVGLLFRFYGHESPSFPMIHHSVQRQRTPFSAAFTRSITDSLTSVLNICSFVLFFTVFLRGLFLSGFLPALSGLMAGLCASTGVTKSWFQQLLTGFVELSSGVLSIPETGSLSGRASMAAFMLGWAGLSVHCQVLSFLGECNLSARTYLTGKLLHGVFSALLTNLAIHCFSIELTVSHFFGQPSEAISSFGFIHSLSLSILCAVGCWILFFLTIVLIQKKRGGKTGRCAL